MSETERWLPIAGWPGYEVSSLGRVRSLKGGAPALLNQRLNYAGRLHTSLTASHRSKSKMVHSLVAEAFIGKRPDGMECNHIDGDRTNNRADNLEWVTPAQNMAHAAANGLVRNGRRCNFAKLTEDDVRSIRTMAENCSNVEIAKRFGVHREAIRKIVRRINWAHVA